ncbi:Ferritin-like domain [Popillia japonica]|uniref:Ferritin n=1 Tax=Popillia japonica TaxID=7064 RepID=A0AAW1KPZ7_POPJA
MKAIVFACVFAICAVGFSSADLYCHHKKPDIPGDWVSMADTCTNSMRRQIQEEINAAMQYMAMGAHFSKDTVNRPGFAKMFFDAASEEREHAIKLISYLLMRGELTTDVSSLIKTVLEPAVVEWKTGIDALRDALQLETSVTKKIRDVIQKCEEGNNDFNDYHLVDYLSGDFLDEQYKGQRDLAGKISTLDKMIDKHGGLAEFLFDKKLLS